MRKLRRKLDSESGVSIVIGLVFFLICLTVGAVVLTAATANAGRVTRIEGEQQAYLAVRSAAHLLRDEIADTAFFARDEKWQTGSPQGGNRPPKDESPPLDKGSAHLGALMAAIEADAKTVFAGGTPEEHSLTVEAEDELPAVAVTWQMDSQYAIVLKLCIDGDSKAFPMTLTITPLVQRDSGTRTVTWTTTSDGVDEQGNPIEVSVEHRGYIDYRQDRVTWGVGDIEKGVGA